MMSKSHSFSLTWKQKGTCIAIIALFVMSTSALTTDRFAGIDYSLATEVKENREISEVNTVVVEEPIVEEGEMPVVKELDWKDYVSEIPFTDEEIDVLAKAVWGHAYSTGSTKQMSAIAWVVMNRVDAAGFPNDIIGVVTQKAQFQSYRASNPVDPAVREIVIDVLSRYTAEKNGAPEVGRVLSDGYLYFRGDGYFNYFYENF